MKMARSTAKQIFIVDDHPVFREGLVGLVTREADLAVCGEADHAAQALSAIESSKPDLVQFQRPARAACQRYHYRQS